MANTITNKAGYNLSVPIIKLNISSNIKIMIGIMKDYNVGQVLVCGSWDEIKQEEYIYILSCKLMDRNRLLKLLKKTNSLNYNEFLKFKKLYLPFPFSVLGEYELPFKGKASKSHQKIMNIYLENKIYYPSIDNEIELCVAEVE